MIKLKKCGGARFHDVETFKISCLANELIGIKTLKNGEENGMNDNDFGHILLSKLTKHDTPVVVKIHYANSYFIRKELAGLQKLKNFDNSVEYLCDFTCMDNKNRWKDNIIEPTKFCRGKKDRLHFIVMEYIENGDLVTLFNKNPSNKELCSIFLQVALVIMIIGVKYKMFHGDLNTGNILIATTDKKYITYNILDENKFVSNNNVKIFNIFIPKYYENDSMAKYNFRQMSLEEKYGGKQIEYNFDTCANTGIMLLGKIIVFF